MRVFIAGIDGYLGFPLAVHLRAHGHEVAGADLLLRGQWVAEVGGVSALPIASRDERLRAWHERFDEPLDFRVGDLMDYDFVRVSSAISSPRRSCIWGRCRPRPIP